MKKKILVVDNDQLVLSMMTDLLEERGHQVLTAGGGLSALNVLNNYTPDIIFLDLIMPDIDGHRLCRIIRNMPELKDAHVVILSAVATEEKEALSKIGADAYIAKGPLAEVAGHIHALLEQWEQKPRKHALEEMRGFGNMFPRRISQELLSVKNHFEIILGSLSEGIVEVNLDNKVVYANPSAVSLLGQAEENLLGKEFGELFDKSERERLNKLTTAIHAGPQAITEQAPLKLDSKSVVLDLIPVNGDGERTIAVLNDVTERKRNEEELRKYRNHLEDLVIDKTAELRKEITEHKKTAEQLKNQTNRLQQYLGIAGVIFLVLKKDRTVELINKKGCDVLGYREEEVIGEDWFNTFIPQEGREDSIKSFEKIVLGELELPEKQEGVVLTKGKKERIISWNNTALRDGEGRITGILSSGEDITDQKKAEKEREKFEAMLQQAQKMKAIGTLAGGVAHDFNNLLMGIQGQASLTMLSIGSDHPDFKRLKIIEDLVKKGASLTGQLLGFAREGKYVVKPTDVNELIEKTTEMFGRTNKAITIDKNYEADLWAVDADRGQVEEMLLHLYLNAGQAMPAGGELYLKTENITLDEDYNKPFKVNPGNYVKITVTDTGVGMDEETKQRIFEPFFTTKENEWGSGLSLASSYGIIKNHGGFINVYTERGLGTTFTIYIPASEKEAAKEKDTEPQVMRGTETILIVDDEKLILEVGEKLLESMGYKVCVAQSGKEAVEMYRQKKDAIDMVILDMIMPGMGGRETYGLLKEINPKVKSLLSSGYSVNGKANEILSLGCNGFIQKPFNMKQLSQKVREILENQ